MPTTDPADDEELVEATPAAPSILDAAVALQFTVATDGSWTGTWVPAVATPVRGADFMACVAAALAKLPAISPAPTSVRFVIA